MWISGEGQVGEAGRYHFGIFRLYPMAYATENKQADYSVTSLPTCLYCHYQHPCGQLQSKASFLWDIFFLIFCCQSRDVVISVLSLLA